jgi:hypothetical protein
MMVMYADAGSNPARSLRDANACESKRIEVAVRFRKLDTPNQQRIGGVAATTARHAT